MSHFEVAEIPKVPFDPCTLSQSSHNWIRSVHGDIIPQVLNDPGWYQQNHSENANDLGRWIVSQLHVTPGIVMCYDDENDKASQRMQYTVHHWCWFEMPESTWTDDIRVITLKNGSKILFQPNTASEDTVIQVKPSSQTQGCLIQVFKHAQIRNLLNATLPVLGESLIPDISNIVIGYLL